MPFLSHGNAEKLENMAETGKHNLKFAETRKVFLEAAESRKSPKRQCRVAETRKSEKKAMESRKGWVFFAESWKQTPYSRPSMMAFEYRFN